MIYRDAFLDPDFANAVAGYIRTPASGLPDILKRLGRADSRREKAIKAAIEHGIANPAKWDRAHRPMILKGRPTWNGS